MIKHDVTKSLVVKTKAIIRRLISELDATTKNIDFIEKIIRDETRGDKSPRRYQAMMKAISQPARALAAKNLALALKNLEQASAN